MRGFVLIAVPTNDVKNQKSRDFSHAFFGLAFGSLKVSVVAPNQITDPSRRELKESKTVRLNHPQNAVSFQFEEVFKHAIIVFGDQQLAEDWLKKPCRYLGNKIPLELINTPLGFQVIEDYLTRIEHGVYQ
jgi:putative toxin-antitoxin system antitoxin component (TIGR02293 family)